MRKETKNHVLMTLTSMAASVELLKNCILDEPLNGAAFLLLIVGMIYWLEVYTDYRTAMFEQQLRDLEALTKRSD